MTGLSIRLGHLDGRMGGGREVPLYIFTAIKHLRAFYFYVVGFHLPDKVEALEDV